jgi:drug/metabolite transporter (DMT)-like permease
MKIVRQLAQPGVLAALGAALLFGAGTPLAKLLLSSINPWMLAGLLYLGSGLGMALYRWLVKAPAVQLLPQDGLWLAGAVLSGGVVGPVLLMLGLSHMAASQVSLLLNAEGVFTALLAWFAFKENFDKRIALGMAAILAGALVLSWPGELSVSGFLPALAVLGACFAWGLDNNLTRKVALHDATWIACIKGLVAGSVNLALALLVGAKFVAVPLLMGAMVVGFLSYGLSLALFVVGLRHLGTARTGAYFSVAPFIGAVLALGMGEPVTWALAVAAALMAFGVWLHLTESHEHLHTHAQADEHDHDHTHDAHHQHPHLHQDLHDSAQHAGNPDASHRHPHQHEPLTHSHPHFPDAHHRHDH